MDIHFIGLVIGSVILVGSHIAVLAGGGHILSMKAHAFLNLVAAFMVADYIFQMTRSRRGSRVMVVGSPHENGQKYGVVALAEPMAYGVTFDGMNMIHKWYTASELKFL